jgi:hypothetical protein
VAVWLDRKPEASSAAQIAITAISPMITPGLGATITRITSAHALVITSAHALVWS